MSLRLGLGNLESKVKTVLDRGGDPDLREQAEQRLSGHGIVHNVPVTANLAELEVRGLFGHDEPVTAVGTSMIIQAACLHRRPWPLAATMG